MTLLIDRMHVSSRVVCLQTSPIDIPHWQVRSAALAVNRAKVALAKILPRARNSVKVQIHPPYVTSTICKIELYLFFRSTDA